VWAVGERFASNASATLIERWDGTAWSVIKSPNPAGLNDFNGLFAIVAGLGEAWPVGSLQSTY
jgi:hypothetical protein